MASAANLTFPPEHIEHPPFIPILIGKRNAMRAILTGTCIPAAKVLRHYQHKHPFTALSWSLALHFYGEALQLALTGHSFKLYPEARNGCANTTGVRN